jgi:hypothetical protein
VHELIKDKRFISFQHRTVLIELELIIDGPPEICPVRTAEISPQLIRVSWISTRTTMSGFNLHLHLPANMGGSRLGACCTKADVFGSIRSSIKAIAAENCHIDIRSAPSLSH